MAESKIYGLTFNKKHCKDLGLVIADNGTRRPLMAESKDTYVDVPHRSGAILVFDESKKDIDIEVDFVLHSIAEGESIYEKCREIAKWLTTKGKVGLVFDDDPTHTYKGKAITGVTFEDIERKAGAFTVVFRCDPFPPEEEVSKP